MAKTNQVNWQPISQMPLIASKIDTSLTDTREHLGTLTEQMDYAENYNQQISRWRNKKASAIQASPCGQTSPRCGYIRARRI